MRATTLNTWPRLFAWQRLWAALFSNGVHTSMLDECSLTDDLRRDLGLTDGRRVIGSDHERKNPETLEAVRLQQGPL